MNLTPDQLIYIAAGFGLAVFLFYVVQVGKRMRGLLMLKFKRILLSVILYLLAIKYCLSQGYPAPQALLISFAVGLLPRWLIRAPKQSRYIPAAVKRAVIAKHAEAQRYEYEQDHYDRRRHHLDHWVPLSKGGDTSVENLRVLSKEANLKKGAKMPRLRDFI